jgi:radical SAM superfamily enzyme YgiQ (UPF0313 family)
MKKVLFLLASSRGIYSKAKVNVAVPERPSLTFATLAAPLLQKGHPVEVLDLNQVQDPQRALEKKLEDLEPDVVGITCTTPLVPEAREITVLVKGYNPSTLVVVGGPHPSAFPRETLIECGVDVVCQGEGDYAMPALVEGAPWASIPGITYRQDGHVVGNPQGKFIENLDALPLPAWKLFDLTKYHTPRLSCRQNPVGTMETSRGCVFGCTYCNKTVFGRTFRAKSVQRVVREMKYMLDQGFAEIHIMDDGFTTDLKRAKEICDLIVERGLQFPWALHNGIRVDRVDREFLDKARAAGCYEVTLGIETGDPEVLKRIEKGTTLDQARQAVRWAKEAGLETLTYFMIGLPGETEESMKRTIDFALELDATYSKVSIFLPLPGTPLFQEFEEGGYLRSKEWAFYNQHDPSSVYEHPNLPWDKILHYYNLFYRRYYLRPSFIWRRLKQNAFSLNLFYDAIDFLRTRW